MNIFALDLDPEVAASYHCDKHVVKMILESAQIICTNAHYVGYDGEIPYKATHTNHPATIWARESKDNMMWLYRLMASLQYHWAKRYNHKTLHKSFEKVLHLNLAKLLELLPDNGLTPFKTVMPDKYIVTGDPVKSYRNYYRYGKANILTYRNGNIPKWLGG